jgi:hypothetical protein
MLCSRRNGTDSIYTIYILRPGKRFPLLDFGGGTLVRLAERQGSTEA